MKMIEMDLEITDKGVVILHFQSLAGYHATLNVNRLAEMYEGTNNGVGLRDWIQDRIGEASGFPYVSTSVKLPPE